MAKRPSTITTTKIALTTEAVTRAPSDSALPPTCMPSTAATMPMMSAMNGALMSPAKMVVRSMEARRRSIKVSGEMPE